MNLAILNVSIQTISTCAQI